MKLSDMQQELYTKFYESTIDDGVLDSKTELLVGLSAAIALGCQPCTTYYLDRCKRAGVQKPELQAVLAKVMAVAAGQKRLETESALERSDINA